MSAQLKKQILRQGNGLQIPPNAVAIVHYTGKFADGRVFDSSVPRGQPFSFNLNQGQVIKGWDISVSTMQQHELSFFEIPPEFGYGDRSTGPIPPNSTLYFEIELLGWQ